MFDVGEIDDYDCCEPISTAKCKDKKHYPNLYLYEIPDALYSSFTAGQRVEITIKAMVRNTSERVENNAENGESTKRTVDLEVREISKP